MRVLLDQCAPMPIRRALQGHTVKTAREQGWDTLENGELLQAVEDAGFDVLLTADTNLLYQQNLKDRKLAIVVLTRNKWSLMRPEISKIVDAVNTAKSGTCVVVDIPGE
jgi:hypothetical protein